MFLLSLGALRNRLRDKDLSTNLHSRICGQWSQETAEGGWKVMGEKGSRNVVPYQVCHRSKGLGLSPEENLNMLTWASPSQEVRGLGHLYSNSWESLMEGCAYRVGLPGIPTCCL